MLWKVAQYAENILLQMLTEMLRFTDRLQLDYYYQSGDRLAGWNSTHGVTLHEYGSVPLTSMLCVFCVSAPFPR